MTTFTFLKNHLDGLTIRYKQYQQRRLISFLLLGLTSLVICIGLYAHTTQLIGLSFLLCGSSLYQFVTAEKLLNSIIDALYTDTIHLVPNGMSVQERIAYLQLKTTLVYKISNEIDFF